MPNKENWGIVNYGQRGRRGYPGVSVKHMDMDSEGRVWSHYSDGRDEIVGQALQGIQGEPGENGRVVDVIIDGNSIVNSEGTATWNNPNPNIILAYGTVHGSSQPLGDGRFIYWLMGPEFVAGDNMEVEETWDSTDPDHMPTYKYTFSAKDTTYTAGENIEISSEGEISAVIPQLLSAGDNIEISSEGVISAIIPDQLVAGDNITISEGVISAKDTKYTAGNYITISSEGVIEGPMVGAWNPSLENQRVDVEYDALNNAFFVKVDFPEIIPMSDNVTVIEQEDGSFLINTKDTTYTAGDHISITSEGIISANIDDVIGEEITVTRDVGGYDAGDVVPATEKLIDIIKHLLGEALPPAPTREYKLWSGVSNEPPINIDPSWGYEMINPDELLEEGRFVKYFNANRQWEGIAFPASMPDLVKIDQGMGNMLSSWTKLEVVYEGEPYKLYYGTSMVKETSSYEFSWRV